MPQKIIIVRHGETDYNKEHRMQGWIDVPLNKIGRNQARAAAAKLVDIKINTVYSSDLERAHETARIIAKSIKKAISTTKALRERDMGIFSGWAWDSERDPIKDLLWEEFELARDNEDLHWNKHNGESLHEMSSRVSMFMDSLHTTHKNQTILIVTHGGTINRILEQYKIKSSSDGFRTIGNASILILYKETTAYRLEEL